MTSVTGLALRSYGDAPLAHSHSHHQLVLALEGRLDMEVAGRGGRVDAAALVVVAGGESHSCRASGRNRFLVLDWEEDDIADDLAARFVDAARRRPFVGLDPALLPLLRYLDTALGDDRIPVEERRDWGRLLLRRLGHSLDAGATHRPVAHPRRLGRALAFLEARLGEPLTVREIAGAAHTSPGHLHELFRRHLGRSPMEHVAALRLDRAMRRLADSDAPIAGIAVASGYADQSALTRAFKRRHGVTPAAYRRRQRAGQQ